MKTGISRGFPTWVLAAGLAIAAAGSAVAQDTVGAQPDALRETYRDWAVRCQTVAGAEGAPARRVCDMSQELTQTESGQRVLSVAFQAGSGGASDLTLVGPFGLSLADGIRVVVGGQDMATIPFRTCLPRGCIATAQLDEAALALLRSGTEAQVIMVADGGRELSLTVSLMGFTAAWNRLQGLQNGG